MAGITAHICHDGRGHPHSWHHIRIGPFRGQYIAFGHLVQFKGGTQKTHGSLACAPGSAIPFQNNFSIRCGFGINFLAPHENSCWMKFKFLIPARFRTSLNKPQSVTRIDTEFCIHNYSAIRLADRTDASRNLFSLTQRQCPAQSLKFRNRNFFCAAFFVVDNFHGFGAHLPNDNFATIITLENVHFIWRNFSTNNCFSKTITCINADKILAICSTASCCRICRESCSRNNRIDHLHHAHRKGGVFYCPFNLGVFRN